MCRDHGIRQAVGQQLPEPGIAQRTRGLFQALTMGFSDAGGIDSTQMEGKIEFVRQGLDEGRVRFGFRSANSVVHVGNRERQPQFVPPLQQGAKQCDRVRATGAGDDDLHPGVEEAGLQRRG